MTRSHKISLGIVAAFLTAAIIIYSCKKIFWPKIDPVEYFMTETYGKYDPSDKLWHPQPAEDGAPSDDVLHKICARNDDKTNNKVFLIAVCSVPDDDHNSHADSGRIGYYAIDRSEALPKVVASLETDGAGSHGNSGDVEVVQLGRSFFGFQVEGGGVFQGIAISGIEIYVPYKNTFKSALQFQSAYNNEGYLACDDCPDQVEDLERTLKIRKDEKSNVYPLKITEHDRSAGKNVTRVYDVYFNKKSWSYIAPKELNSY